MANKLTDLTVEKIAFVDEGDNPEADILIFKRKPTEPTAEGKDEGGDEGIIKRLATALAKVPGLSDGSVEKKETATDDDTNPEDKTELEGDEPSSTEADDDTDIPDEDEEKSAKKDTDKQKKKEPCSKKHEDKKGDFTDMSKIDKSKLTPEELAQLEAIEKKALVDEPEDEPKGVKKGAGAANEDGADDIYKGIHPTVKAELEALQKFRSEAEDRELLTVAKRYEIIGKKPEELVKTFKSLKAAGGTAYDEMIAVLDSTVKTVTDAGVFGEVGKRGGVDDVDSADKAWAKLEKHAEEIRKAKPELTRAEAIDEAAIQHPELVHEYEDNM